MESAVKKLRQQRATLGARQGDPDAPTSGTLFARRRRLRAELERVESDQVMARQAPASRQPHLSTASGVVPRRSAAAIRREIHLVEQEIDSLQQRIEDIDRLLAEAETKCRG